MTTSQIPECITISETEFGIRRFYAKCSEHPRWRPGMEDTRRAAESGWNLMIHIRDCHDDIDRTGMPTQLVVALARISDVSVRRQVARGARDWARRTDRIERGR